MAEKTYKLMNDSPIARWTVLILVALMMFFAYMFVDVMSPLKSLVESSLGWNSSVFGTYAASEYILNVCGFLIIAGVILDKLGVRFSGILSAGLMVAGALIKFIAVSDWFQGTAFCDWLGSWWVEMPGSAKLASLGFMIFGCGCEMEGTNVSKILAKWFKGKEMALAMGLEMAIARLGVFAVMWIAPMISSRFDASIMAPVGLCGALLVIGLLNFVVFGVMDRKFDAQLIEAGMATAEKSPEDEFHVSDLKAIFTSKMFWIVSLLCVLYYSAIFPFQRYATNFLEETLLIPADEHGDKAEADVLNPEDQTVGRAQNLLVDNLRNRRPEGCGHEGEADAENYNQKQCEPLLGHCRQQERDAQVAYYHYH